MSVLVWTGEDGEDADATERGQRRADDAVLRRSAGLLLAGVVARRPGSVRARHVALLCLGRCQAASLRDAQRQLSPRLSRGDVHVGDALLPPARLHHHHDVDARQEEPRRSRHRRAGSLRRPGSRQAPPGNRAGCRGLVARVVW